MTSAAVNYPFAIREECGLLDYTKLFGVEGDPFAIYSRPTRYSVASSSGCSAMKRWSRACLPFSRPLSLCDLFINRPSLSGRKLRWICLRL